MAYFSAHSKFIFKKIDIEFLTLLLGRPQTLSNEGESAVIQPVLPANVGSSSANKPVNLTVSVERIISTPSIPVIDITSD